MWPLCSAQHRVSGRAVFSLGLQAGKGWVVDGVDSKTNFRISAEEELLVAVFNAPCPFPLRAFPHCGLGQHAARDVDVVEEP